MRAMLLLEARHPLVLSSLPDPAAGPGQVVVRVHACGVCRTDLHIADGELSRPKLPLVLGHQVVGRSRRPGEARSSAGGKLGRDPMDGMDVRRVPVLAQKAAFIDAKRDGRDRLAAIKQRLPRSSQLRRDDGHTPRVVAASLSVVGTTAAALGPCGSVSQSFPGPIAEAVSRRRDRRSLTKTRLMHPGFKSPSHWLAAV